MKNVFHAIKIFLWALLGVRSSKGHQGDIKSQMSPVVLIVVALFLTALFVGTLIGLALFAVNYLSP